MARVVLLVDADLGDRIAVDPETASGLARLGVTNLTFARDARTVAIVIEGWAFDLTRAGDALALVSDDPKSGRVLHPVADMAVAAALDERTAR